MPRLRPAESADRVKYPGSARFRSALGFPPALRRRSVHRDWSGAKGENIELRTARPRRDARSESVLSPTYLVFSGTRSGLDSPLSEASPTEDGLEGRDTRAIIRYRALFYHWSFPCARRGVGACRVEAFDGARGVCLALQAGRQTSPGARAADQPAARAGHWCRAATGLALRPAGVAALAQVVLPPPDDEGRRQRVHAVQRGEGGQLAVQPRPERGGWLASLRQGLPQRSTSPPPCWQSASGSFEQGSENRPGWRRGSCHPNG